MIGISNALADEIATHGSMPDFLDAQAAGKALAALNKPLRIGVPFPFSMHAELLHYWLSAFGLSLPN